MSNSINVHVVHHLHHLLEVVATDWCAKVLECYIVKKLTAFNELESHVGDWLVTFRLNPNCVILKFDEVDHVRMLKGFEHINFGLKCT